MKNTFFFLLFLIFFVKKNIAQNCLTGNNFFTTQSQIDSFPILYPDCIHIEGNIQLGEFGTNITNFDSLQQLVAISGDLVIFYNQNISNLNGLNNLESVDGKVNIKNNSITSLSGLEKLVTIGTDFIINNNDSLINLVGLDKISFIGNEMFILENDNLVNLHGLENLVATSGLRVHENSSLENFIGLNNVNIIDGSFDIVSNDTLINFQGLEKVDSITGNFLIQFCPSLETMMGLENLKSVGNNFTIRANNTLTSLGALENLTHVQGPGINISNNYSMTSLSGIDNIDMADLNTVDNLFLEYSDSLSFCSVKNVCDYLLAGGVYFINDNATGCNTKGEILSFCDFTDVKNLEEKIVIEIFPNPTNGFLEIKKTNTSQISFQIFNSVGTKIIDDVVQENKTLDLSFHPKGIYFFVVKNQENSFIKKIIKL